MSLGPPHASQWQGLSALWVSTAPINENDGFVRFFTPHEGVLYLKARGILKAGSKLAPLLKTGDELALSVATARGAQLEHDAEAERGGLPHLPKVLTGVSVQHEHRLWHTELRHTALAWWMLECCCMASAAPLQNGEMYRLTVNLLRSEPQESVLYACACAFALKLLAIHGLLPDLQHCSLDGHTLAVDEPGFLLPSGEGLVGREQYNERYARSGAALPRLDPARRLRWLMLLHGALLDYPASGADAMDAALLLEVSTQHLADLAHRPLESAEFLRRQWKLEDWNSLSRRGT